MARGSREPVSLPRGMSAALPEAEAAVRNTVAPDFHLVTFLLQEIQKKFPFTGNFQR